MSSRATIGKACNMLNVIITSEPFSTESLLIPMTVGGTMSESGKRRNRVWTKTRQLCYQYL